MTLVVWYSCEIRRRSGSFFTCVESNKDIFPYRCRAQQIAGEYEKYVNHHELNRMSHYYVPECEIRAKTPYAMDLAAYFKTAWIDPGNDCWVPRYWSGECLR